MYLEFHIATSRLNALIQNSIEHNILARGVGMEGLLDDIPFFTDILQLLRGELESVTAAIDHIRVSSVEFSADGTLRRPPISTEINVPPNTSLFEPTPSFRTISIDLQPAIVQAIIEMHIVRKNDMLIANGNAVAASNMMVVQCKANIILSSLTVSGNVLSLAPSIVDIELGASDIFFNLPPASDREGLSMDEQLGLFRDRNLLLATLSDDRTASLFQFLLRVNGPEVLGNISIPALPLNISGINELLSSISTESRIWNAGLFLNQDHAVINIQAERAGAIDFLGLGSADTRWVSEWRSFFANGSSNRLGGAEWSFYVPSEIFLEKLHKNIVDGITANPNYEMSAGGDPRSEWQIIGGTPDLIGTCNAGSTVRILTDFAIFIPGACQPTGLGIDANVRLTISISLQAGPQLQGDLHIDFSPDEGDMALCAIINSHLTAGGGFVIGGAFGIIGAAIGAAIGGFLGGIATLAVGYTYDPGPLVIGGGFQPIPDSDRDFIMQIPLNTDLSLTSGRMRINELAACPDGFCVRGNIISQPMELFLATNLNSLEPFEWSELGLCASAGVIIAATAAQWGLERTRVGFPNMQLTLLKLQVLGTNPEAHGSLLPRATLEHSGGMILDMSIDQATALALMEAIENFDDSFLEIFVQTNVGARIVRFNAFNGTLTRDNLDSFIVGRRRFCGLTEALERVRRAPRRFRYLMDQVDGVGPRLTVNLAKDARVMSIWTIMASEMQGGDVLRIGRAKDDAEDSAMDIIREFKPHEGNKNVSARVLEFNHKDKSQLMLHLVSGAGRNSATGEKGILAMQRQYFYEIARIPISGTCHDVAIKQVKGEIYVAVLTSAGLSVYHTDVIFQPRLIFSHILYNMNQLGWQREILILQGDQCKAYYSPEVNRLQSEDFSKAPNIEKPCWMAPDGKSSSGGLKDISIEKLRRRHHEGFDDRGITHYFETFGKVVFMYNNTENFVSIYHLYNTKLPDTLSAAKEPGQVPCTLL